ncbi:SPOR domain-containing protein [Anaerobiospirillum sp. NML120448]|uniref:SPOR domain-containing protein n=1 Tax=Anaerobiospirillum sp. NML120448 TaxID=2932816 RepID=UPI001FF176D4|nr:SPOR domain-containing protein [Anaerobiospirillum sp. NML120448]MCK0515232.1 SPOR domain-containing protein [Anaerobiospirillum sp. NML120448]
MVISKSLRNRLVGFAIVASSILIFLPVILSKDVIVKQNPDAVAVDSNGAVLNQEGQLTYQPSANMEQALNINNQNGVLNLTPEPNNNNLAQQQESNNQGSVDVDSSVEMLEFSKPNNANANANINGTEILTANNNKVNSAPTQAQPNKTQEPEILTASKPSANTPVKKPAVEKKEPEILVAQKAPSKPQATPASAKNNANSKDDVLAGTRPNERFVVQVGVFSKKDNAMNVVNTLKKAGISYYAVKVVNANGSSFYRVYGGRSNNKAELSSLSARIDKLCGTKSKVVPL